MANFAPLNRIRYMEISQDELAKQMAKIYGKVKEIPNPGPYALDFIRWYESKYGGGQS
jgi:hypothetical protein